MGENVRIGMNNIGNSCSDVINCLRPIYSKIFMCWTSSFHCSVAWYRETRFSLRTRGRGLPISELKVIFVPYSMFHLFEDHSSRKVAQYTAPGLLDERSNPILYMGLSDSVRSESPTSSSVVLEMCLSSSIHPRVRQFTRHITSLCHNVGLVTR